MEIDYGGSQKGHGVVACVLSNRLVCESQSSPLFFCFAPYFAWCFAPYFAWCFICNQKAEAAANKQPAVSGALSLSLSLSLSRLYVLLLTRSLSFRKDGPSVFFVYLIIERKGTE